MMMKRLSLLWRILMDWNPLGLWRSRVVIVLLGVILHLVQYLVVMIYVLEIIVILKEDG